MAQKPICVRRTNTVEEAEIIVAWLEDHGVKATVPDRESFGVRAFGVTDHEGVEIYVADAETADRAKTLLAEHDREHARSQEDATAQDVVELTCGECGEISSFPSDLRGTVQECAKCGTYLDVPDEEGSPPG